MRISIRPLLTGTVWTTGTYIVVQGLRFATNIVLARLLAPELFGIMLIVNSLRTGITLISDFGIGQNIVHNKSANDPDFYNTAWSLEIIRNVVLWLIFLAAAAPVAHFYSIPVLTWVMPVTALALIFTAFSSMSRHLLYKRLLFAKLGMFETAIAVVSSIAHIVLAYLSPTVWALVFGGLFTSATSMIGSYFLLPGVKQRFFLSRKYAWEILHFGKWIFASSLLFFLAMNYDRLYLAKIVTLETLGVYGIARSLSELLGMLTSRVGTGVLFPFIASYSEMPRADLRQQLLSIRTKFLLLAAFGFSVFVATADLAIDLLYDHRYQAAGWMLEILLLGSWFSMLAGLNESKLLGLGKPSYSAVSNGTKFGFLLIGLPIAFKLSGLPGCVIVIALADVARYSALVVGQLKERFSFAAQDLLITIGVIALIGFWSWLRWAFGFGTPFGSMLTEMLAMVEVGR